MKVSGVAEFVSLDLELGAGLTTDRADAPASEACVLVAPATH